MLLSMHPEAMLGQNQGWNLSTSEQRRRNAAYHMQSLSIFNHLWPSFLRMS